MIYKRPIEKMCDSHFWMGLGSNSHNEMDHVSNFRYKSQGRSLSYLEVNRADFKPLHNMDSSKIG